MVSEFVFGGLLQLPSWYGPRFIIEDRNVTCKSLILTVNCWMAVSCVIKPQPHFYILILQNLNGFHYLIVAKTPLVQVLQLTRNR